MIVNCFFEEQTENRTGDVNILRSVVFIINNILLLRSAPRGHFLVLENYLTKIKKNRFVTEFVTNAMYNNDNYL